MARVKPKLFFSYYLFFVRSGVKCGAVIAATVCRSVQTEDISLDEFKLRGITQDNTESYDICSSDWRG
jgi:hypothetical protein